jgi:hypothetical protein
MANIPWLRAVCKHDAMRSAWIQHLAIYHKPPRCFSAVINYLPMKLEQYTNKQTNKQQTTILHHARGICVIYHSFQPISIQESNYQVYNDS